MTMQLYNWWQRAASPPPATIVVHLRFYVCAAHNFRPPQGRTEVLWRLLRPQSNDRDLLLEEDDGQ